MPKPSADGKSVTVVKGDTLWDIANTYLGSGTMYKKLATINNISNPDLIYVGQTINLTTDSSSSGSTKTPVSNTNRPIVNHFGEQSNNEGTLFATWTWSKDNTASYKVLWTYSTGDGVWFQGANSTITVDKDAPDLSKQSTYSIPSNAKQVKFKVKPISETYEKNKKETNYWTAEWSAEKTWTDSTPLTAPNTPDVIIEKYKLTATLDNVTIDADQIEFQIVKNNSTVFKTGKASVVTGHVSYSCNVDAGGEYKVRCRAVKGSSYSDWSAYSSNGKTIPAASSGITVIRAASETSVYVEWEASPAATKYDLEYSTKKEYFDGSDQTTPINGIESTHYEKTGLESGTEYFFRVRAVNDEGESSWSDIKSVVVGKAPSAPTTWSSTTTVITGEPLTLYWVHNAEDGSSQTYAQLELNIDGFKETRDIPNSTDEDEKDKTSSYAIDTTPYKEGTKIEWRVRTAGITKQYGDWSVQRTVDIYAPPTLELRVTDAQKVDSLEVIESFPFYIYGLPGPNTQVPIGYHLSIVANEMYETVDNIGNEKIVNAGEEVYSKYFDISHELFVEFSPSNIDLQNNINYKVQCLVSMDSGLTHQESVMFSVQWTDVEYEPNAEIGIDPDTITASIRPYCENSQIVCYRVNAANDIYTRTSEQLEYLIGEIVAGVKTESGELVYSGMTAEGEELYFCQVIEKTPITDVLLSVYRREFDGSFTEIASGLDGAMNTTVTDPHPSLDYARYRVVAVTKDTGAVSYYDLPGYPVGEYAIIIQWDEEWTNFDVTNEDALVQRPWSGSLLKLPYNIDVSDGYRPDVAQIEYIGRSHPIAYYGTQRGETATWNTEIPASDKETLYALRRLAIWMGDVYVREPSGSGYWAHITVSFSQKHCGLTIPVTLDIVRVEGGV